MADAQGEPARPRAEHRARGQGERHHQPAGIADVVELLEDVAEDRAGQHPAVGHLPRGDDVEGHRRCDGPECDEAAHPDHEGQEGRVPQRKHRVIIMDGPRPPAPRVARAVT